MPSPEQIKLEEAIKIALNTANNELCVLKQQYKEENLRYVVMTEISEVKCFGVFPNIDENKDRKLCFQTEYNGGKYKPDIVSLCFTKFGEVKKLNPLVIELKKMASIKELEIDFNKAHHYLKDLGDMKFGIAVIINIGIPEDKKKISKEKEKISEEKKMENYIWELKKVLQKHRTKLKLRSWGQNLGFAWYNPLSNKPELIWLNQKEKIVLGTNKKK
jgi:hypothetical protein